MVRPAGWPTWLRPGVELRLALGLVAILMALLFLIDVFFGLVPDRTRQELETRQLAAASMALLVTQALERDEPVPRDAIAQVARQQGAVRAVALRPAGQPARALLGDPSTAWHLPPGERSTLAQVRVAITDAARRPWGDLEIAFEPAGPASAGAWLASPTVRALAALVLLALGAVWLYLRRVLQHLDPGQVIPQRVRDAFDVLDEGIAILDPQARVMMANEAFRRLAPAPGPRAPRRALAIGEPVTRLGWLCEAVGVTPQDDDAAPWREAVRRGAPSDEREVRLPGAPGEPAREALLRCTPVLDPDGRVRGALLRLRDVSALHQLNRDLARSREELAARNEELGRLATRDPMTGSLNRRAFFEQAARLFDLARHRGAGLACVMADIDHFKQFNDRHGHATGDQVIRAVAAILASGVRGTDLVCRYGGEEFCLLLPDADAGTAAALAERLRAEIEAEAGARVQAVPGLRVTASFGLAVHGPGLTRLEELIDRADQALYRAKRAGRNRVGREDDLPAAGSETESAG